MVLESLGLSLTNPASHAAQKQSGKLFIDISVSHVARSSGASVDDVLGALLQFRLLFSRLTSQVSLRHSISVWWMWKSSFKPQDPLCSNGQDFCLVVVPYSSAR